MLAAPSRLVHSRARRFGVVAAVTGCLALGAASTARAQATLTTNVASVQIPAPTEHEYDAQYSAIQQLSFQTANCPAVGTGCSITLAATSPTLGNGKPVDQVEWQLNGTGNGNWKVLSTIPADVISAPPGGSAGGIIYFRVKIGWSSDGADQLYAANVRLAVTQR